MFRWLGLVALLASLSSPVSAQEAQPSIDEICRTLAEAAADNAIPEEFFTRLIGQESTFDPKAVSPMGAQGIAQFMPRTAALRHLVNAFEPLQALRESASYLSELRTTFGNLGLAAAAYNAGPTRSRPGSPAAAPPFPSRHRPMSASSRAFPWKHGAPGRCRNSRHPQDPAARNA